jgi:predicted phosphodiesterase
MTSGELRVAVFTDVHGNLPALRAVLAEIDRRGPWDRIIAGGDYCLNGANPAEAFDLSRERADAVLQGNTDRDNAEAGASDPDLGARKRASIEWTCLQLGAERTAALAGLAFDSRVEAPDGRALLVVHANPRDLDRHIVPDASETELDELVGGVDADILAFGHLHIAYRRRFRALRLFDIAACGLPRDGDRRAVWGSFTWAPRRGWRGTIHRTAYDVGDTVERILDSGMPDAIGRIRDLVRATYE